MKGAPTLCRFPLPAAEQGTITVPRASPLRNRPNYTYRYLPTTSYLPTPAGLPIYTCHIVPNIYRYTCICTYLLSTCRYLPAIYAPAGSPGLASHVWAMSPQAWTPRPHAPPRRCLFPKPLRVAGTWHWHYHTHTRLHERTTCDQQDHQVTRRSGSVAAGTNLLYHSHDPSKCRRCRKSQYACSHSQPPSAVFAAATSRASGACSCCLASMPSI
jgi:hypothetical protein